MPLRVIAHAPQAAVGLEKQAMTPSSSDRRDIAGHNHLGKVVAIVGCVGCESAVAQLAETVVTHGPQAAIASDKQAMVKPRGDRGDSAGHNLLGAIGVTESAVAQLAVSVPAHRPQTAI